jgi:tetratricopeptide (TPR) repeat protein
MLRARLASLVLCVAATVAGPALAQQPHTVDTRVRDLVYAADDAYRDGRYEEAAEAFEEAYHLNPQAALLFNVGKCHEKRWLVKPAEVALRAAVEAYRRYLAVVDRSSPKSRHGEAELALERLTPAFERLAASTTKPATERAPAPRAARATRIMIGASVPGAQVRIDSGPSRDLPLVEPVAPGKHHLLISRNEYLDEERDVIVGEGELAPIHAELRPAPGRLVVDAPTGTGVYVDGRFVGRAPLAQPLVVDAGPHAVALLDLGRSPWGRTVDVARAGTATVAGDPRRSAFRWASFGLMGLAGVSAAVAGYEFGSSLAHGLWADRFLNKRSRGEVLTEGELAAYAHDVDAYESARTNAFTFGTTASVLGLAAAGLYFIDRPTVADVVYEKDEAAPAPSAASAPSARLVPSFVRGGASLDLSLSF